MQDKPLLSIIVVFHNEQIENILPRLSALMRTLSARVDLLFIDNGTRDDIHKKITAHACMEQADRVQLIRLSRQFGAMSALQAGIANASGDCVTMWPFDERDPPEAIITMFESWHNTDVKANFTVRENTGRKSWFNKAPIMLFHTLLKRYVLPDHPQHGIGFFLLDRQIVDELRHNMPRHTDLILYAFSMGYQRQLHITQSPADSAENEKYFEQIKYALNNFIAFSYLPVRLMSIAGFGVALLGFMFAIYVFIAKTTGWLPLSQPPGWATLVILITVCSGLIMTMLGIIGEYLWRILDNVRQSPPYLIDDIQPPAPAKETQEKRQETPLEQRK